MQNAVGIVTGAGSGPGRARTVGGSDDRAATTLAVVARSEVVRRGLAAVLRSVPMVGTVRQCGSPEEAAVRLRSERFDFVIAAASDAGWLAPVHRSLAEAGTAVLVLVDDSAIHDPSTYASIPVDGFLSHLDLSADTLRDVLHRCRLGQLPIPPDLARALLARVDEPLPRQRSRIGNLTRRELEVLSLLARGLSNKQIAHRLSISSHGAKRLVSNVMLKLGSPNRTSAAVLAVRAGILHHHPDGTVPAVGAGRSAAPHG
jgi:two-component system nitrate/nitrite response regulator NarL